MKVKTKIKILILLGAVVVTGGFRCKFITPSQQQLLEPIELTWWGVFDDSTDLNELINDYRAIHPNITINYRKLRFEEFETELLDALAEDRGPDIFSVHNTWVTKYLSKIEPLPQSTTMAYQVTQKSLGIKTETIVEVRENTSLTAAQLKNNFIDVVHDDVVRDGKVYGLPLTIDTMVLFYNRDLFNNAGIPLPPTDWVEIQDDVKKLTFQNTDGKLTQAGIALGRADNVERSSDILALLMIQNGAEMVNGNKVAFASIPNNFPDRTYNPGPEAVRFYTDFATPSKEVYSWSNTFGTSIDAFAEGRVAMIFGYNYHLPILEAKRQGKLNYAIAPMPQIEGRGEINFANYWIHTVSKKSQNINAAWDFIQFIASKDEVKKYLEKTQRPAALRSLIEDQTKKDELQIFAKQLLTAKSWYKGSEASVVDSAFGTMINEILSGAELQASVGKAAVKIQQTL
ncbi:MAG: extracellular solute-binding protein [Patescibacteria group bacterium]|jgi:multiple sugar transport system substrate-binding protein|nr:extracellular solute-binding protein [Patescibacteria group bacterium]